MSCRQVAEARIVSYSHLKQISSTHTFRHIASKSHSFLSIDQIEEDAKIRPQKREYQQLPLRVATRFWLIRSSRSCFTLPRVSHTFKYRARKPVYKEQADRLFFYCWDLDLDRFFSVLYFRQKGKKTGNRTFDRSWDRTVFCWKTCHRTCLWTLFYFPVWNKALKKPVQKNLSRFSAQEKNLFASLLIVDRFSCIFNFLQLIQVGWQPVWSRRREMGVLAASERGRRASSRRLGPSRLHLGNARSCLSLRRNPVFHRFCVFNVRFYRFTS